MPDFTPVAMIGFNLALAVSASLVLWGVAQRIRDVSFIDAFWAFGMVLMAMSSFLLADAPIERRALLTGLCTLWGLRLGLHLFGRWRRDGVDRRYASLFERAKARGMGFPVASLIFVFLPQAILMWMVSLPVQLGQTGDSLGLLTGIGVALAITGIAIESVADAQLEAFRKDKSRAGQVMDSGLWRYSRHPNYFGDACVWWGLFIIALDAPLGLWALPGPIFLTWTLLKWSGAPLLEKSLQQSRPDYADYVRRTSGFILWPPKRLKDDAQKDSL